MRDCYSSLKVFHHRSRIDALRNGGHPPPVHVHLVPTNRCNQNCSFCAYRTKGYSSSEDFSSRDEMPTDRLLDLVTELKGCGVRAIELTGGGEPTVHPHFPALCSLIADHGMDFGLVTNGANLNDESLSVLKRAKWVRFSIDAGTAETYSSIRRVKPETFDTVRSNLRLSVRLRGNDNSPVIGVGFVVTKDNWGEVLQAARSAEEDGADNIRISAVFQDEGADYFSEFFSGITNLCRRAEALTNGTFTVFNLFGERIEDLRQTSPDYERCNVQRWVVYIGADLNVYRCCVLAYNQRGLLGSIKDRTFGEFWTDPETIQRLNDFDARECPRCMFNAKNRTIRYALNENPEHVNFL